jgi:tRNA dimethylallyltransferase
MVRPPLLVIVGPTGVGKTTVAVELAARLRIEAVSADSRQVYRGLDAGTGKPTAEEQRRLRHHLLDVAEPGERYHAARFRAEALGAIEDIRRRGALPVVVGGTGLYVRALLKGLRPGPPANLALRAELESLALSEGGRALHRRLATLDPATAERLHPHDQVRLVRALERALVAGAGPAAPVAEPAPGDWATSRPPWRLLMVGLTLPRGVLRERLARRVRGMLAHGMMEEVGRLLAAGVPESAPGLSGIGYRHVVAAWRGQLAPGEVERLMLRDTWRYARRQHVWFARDPEIQWLDVDAAGGPEGAAETIAKRAAEEGLIG